jgi:hypothetical protein
LNGGGARCVTVQAGRNVAMVVVVVMVVVGGGGGVSVGRVMDSVEVGCIKP